MGDKLIPLFDKPVDEPTDFHGLLGWSADWRCINDPEEKPVPLDHIESLDPKDNIITVRRGDTLGKIAKDNSVSIKELAEYNGIKNASLIYPGQEIRLPSYKYTDEISVPETHSHEQCIMSFTFQDLIEKPIQNLKVKLVALSGDVYESVTNEMGKISDFILDKVSDVQVFVSAGTGEPKKIANISPTESKNNIQLTSPKVRIRGTSSALNGDPGQLDSQVGVLNTVTKGRDSKGNPIIQINHACPNEYDLNLGKNIIYWDDIISASKRSGIIPQSIAAVINAESAKDKELIWKQESVCYNYGEMKKRKKARAESNLTPIDIVLYKSSAAGMTQFLNKTWFWETFRKGTFLNDKAREMGLLADKPKMDKHGKPILKKDKTPVLETQFNVSPDVWNSMSDIVKGGYLLGKTPYPKKATKSIQDWLNMRFKSLYAIMAAVDYGMYNLSFLKEIGYNVDSLNDAEKAKVMYLMHNLGAGDAKKFIGKTINEERAEELLIAQVGKDNAVSRAKMNSGSYVRAHRLWLSAYIDQMIKVELFYCPRVMHGSQVTSEDVFSILNKI